MKKLVKDLKPGDMVDLENDRYATIGLDDDRKDLYAYEYATVGEIEQETPKCVRVDFDNFPSVGFPPDHIVTVAHILLVIKGGQQDAYAAAAAHGVAFCFCHEHKGLISEDFRESVGLTSVKYESEVAKWFLEAGEAPFPAGTLLYYKFQD